MSLLLKILSPLLLKFFLKKVSLYLDGDALFTNIPLDETIDIYVKKLFQTLETLVKAISINDFRDLLNLATKESCFKFSNNFYVQVDSVPMGSPLGPILANIFLSLYEEN